MSKEHLIGPVKLLRGVVDLLIHKADQAMEVDFNPADYLLPDYKVEAPAQTEAELMEGIDE